MEKYSLEKYSLKKNCLKNTAWKILIVHAYLDSLDECPILTILMVNKFDRNGKHFKCSCPVKKSKHVHLCVHVCVCMSDIFHHTSKNLKSIAKCVLYHLYIVNRITHKLCDTMCYFALYIQCTLYTCSVQFLIFEIVCKGRRQKN